MRPSLATAAVCALALGLSACPHPTPRVPDAGSPSNDAGPPPAPPLGAHRPAAGDSITFAVRSAAATRIEIELFAQPIGSASVLSVPLQQSGEVWSATVKTHDLQNAGISGTVYYGYRAWGPNWPFDPSWAPGSNAGFVADVDDQGNRFNPNKLLVDPYARELSHDPFQPTMPDPSVYGVGSNDRDKDSAPSAPKGIVLPDAPLDSGVRPTWPLRDDVIYEVHLRGLTENYPDAGCPGTYAAAATQAGYLSALGITAVEFLPVQETQNDTNTDTAPGNYWGYSTLGFFSPDRHYACDKTPGGPTHEFAAMVAAFHAQGLKVFLDVVYNHTSETGSSSLFSFRGLDNARYYELDATGHGNADFTGLGGTVNTSTPMVRDLVMDSLHYWVGSLGVDGFRFDLGAILGNACSAVCFQFDATDAANVLNRAVAELPGIALIAEPWGIGNGTYEVGSFPPGWSTWNDQNRDRLKRSQNALGAGSPDPGGIATSVAGSSDIYGTGGRGPWASINYVVSHDGFTLHDQYSCTAPNDSQAFPYGPSSGGSNNDIPWDQGGDPALQAQAARNGFALILTQAGVPMFTGGDEFGRTIRCNNNSYNLDSIGTWLDWSLLPANQTLQTFASRAIGFRRAHSALRPSAYWTGTDHNGNGLKDVTWYDPSGAEASGAYFSDANANFLAWRVDGTEAGDTVRSIYVAYNQGTAAVTATLPPAASGFHWYQLGDTSAAMAGAGYFAAPGSESVWSPGTYPVAPRSVAVLVERP
jgi:isoamylase